MGDPTMMMGIGFVGLLSVISSAGVFLFKDKICASNPQFPLVCSAVSPTKAPVIVDSPVIATTSAPAPTTSAPSTGTGGGSGGITKKFAPYVLLNGTSLKYVGTHTNWTTLAFVVGYVNRKIQWDAGIVNGTALKAKIEAAKKKGGGVIVSFGGQGAGAMGTKYLSELAGKYLDPQKLADAYDAIATALGSTWLDFDVEGRALKDTAAIDRRNKALYLLQQKRKDMKISFTVPTGVNGLSAETKALLTKAKGSGVRIDVVNIMTMYFTSTKTSMSAATIKAVNAAKPFIKELGAKVGITPQIGKNPDKPYTHENFTIADATKVVTFAKGDADVALVSFWSLNNDVSKHKGGYTKAFKGYAA